jgi:O-methyltransferase
VDLVKGWFKDTLTEECRTALAIGKASLIMIDCDTYSASRDALRFCEPHIDRHAVVLFDDWGWREEVGEIGQKEAFAEFLAEHRDILAEPMPSYLPQARIFLLRRRRVSPGRAEEAVRRPARAAPGPRQRRGTG